MKPDHPMGARQWHIVSSVWQNTKLEKRQNSETGPDSTTCGARRIIGSDLAGFVTSFLAPLSAKSVPVAGDLGVIDLSGRNVAAICSGPFWAIKTKRSVAFLRTDPIIIWG
jgi:hypothetical protein